MGSAGQFSFGISHVVTIRRQLGLESGHGKTQIAVFTSISMWSSLMVFTQGALGFQVCVLRKSTGFQVALDSTQHHSCPILLIRGESLRPVLFKGRGFSCHPLIGGVAKKAGSCLNRHTSQYWTTDQIFDIPFLLVLPLFSFRGSLRTEPDRSLFFHSCLPSLLYYYSGRTEAR